MKSAPLPSNEKERLKSLHDHKILDSPSEGVYDDITKIASEICGTPIALFTLIDEDRQWFKSTQGIEGSETPRDLSFCAHAILNPDEPFIVPDARYDERFHDNPYTKGEPNVVFYAGIPVKDENGLPMGSLCVIDSRPRELPEKNLEALKALGKLVSVYLELRKLKLDHQELKTAAEAGKENAAIISEGVRELQKDPNLAENQQLKKIYEASAKIQELHK